MAAIGDENQFYAELFRGCIEDCASGSPVLWRRAAGVCASSWVQSAFDFILAQIDQTNVSAWRTASLAFAMGTNWSRVGSAQQYQGSLRYGTVAREASSGSADSSADLPAARLAARQIRSNVAARPRFSFSLGGSDVLHFVRRGHRRADLHVSRDRRATADRMGQRVSGSRPVPTVREPVESAGECPAGSAQPLRSNRVAATARSRSRYSSNVVHGVKGTNVGCSVMPARRNSFDDAKEIRARVAFFWSFCSMASSSDSTARNNEQASGCRAAWATSPHVSADARP